LHAGNARDYLARSQRHVGRLQPEQRATLDRHADGDVPGAWRRRIGRLSQRRRRHWRHAHTLFRVLLGAAMASTPQFVSAPNLGCAKFQNSDGTTGKTVFTVGSNGSRVLAMVATSDSLSALQFTLTLERSSVSYKVDTFTIPGADL